MLSKVTLTEYGYTFVAKGVQTNEHDDAHEINIYSHIAALQGRYVPVYLGSITLARPYPLVSLAKVTKMLLSWAGTSLCFSTCYKDVNIRKSKNGRIRKLAQSGA